MNVISRDQIRNRKEITKNKTEMKSLPLFERIYVNDGPLIYGSQTSKAFSSKQGSITALSERESPSPLGMG